jgi:hypothetical protein
MSNRPCQRSTHQEVIVMFEPHRLHSHCLRAAYASLVPIPRRRLATTHQPGPVPWDQDHRLLPEQKGASYE